MKIEPITKETINPLTTLILELWPECSFEEEHTNCLRILNSEKETFFLASEEKNYIGFISLSIRTDYVDGAASSPVGYIEGLYVKSNFRKSGVAKMLVEAGEKWSKEKGCKQYASDAELNNEASIEFHKKIGFEETNRIVTFLKEIE